MSPPMRKNVARGVRNNNPGNLRLRPSKTRPGYLGSDKDGFALFDTPENGLNSLARLLVSYRKRGFDTIRKITRRYAPPSENDTALYEAYVCRMTGLGPDEKLPLSSDWFLVVLMLAIIRFENGVQPYKITMVSAAARVAIGEG